MAGTSDQVPGNFYSFEFFIELKINDVVHLGHPTVCLTNMCSGVVRWGPSIDWLLPDPKKRRVPWVDDEQNGFANRTLLKPEDALGAEGSIGNMRLRFEQILDLGRNVVVYALYCPEKDIRLAYGFNRQVFEPSYKIALSPNPRSQNQ